MADPVAGLCLPACNLLVYSDFSFLQFSCSYNYSEMLMINNTMIGYNIQNITKPRKPMACAARHGDNKKPAALASGGRWLVRRITRPCKGWQELPSPPFWF